METSPRFEVNGFSHLILLRDRCMRREPSDFRPNPTSPYQAPAPHRFTNGKQSRRHKNQPQPQHVINDDDPRNQTKRPNHAAGNAALSFDVWSEETAHA